MTFHDFVVAKINFDMYLEYFSKLLKLHSSSHLVTERVSLRGFTGSEAFLQLLVALSQGNDLSELQSELHEFEA